MTVTTATRQRLAAALTSQSAAGEILDLLEQIGESSIARFDITKEAYGATEDSDDNIDAINLALADAVAYTVANPGEHAEVYVPEGEYTTNNISITADRIRLAGKGTLIFLSSNTTSAAFIDSLGDHFEIEGLTLDCNNAGNSGSGHGVRVWGDYNYVGRLNVRNSNDTGIQLHDDSRYSVVADCEVDDCPRSLRVRGDYVAVSRCRFLGFTSDKGITVDPSGYDTSYFSMKDVYAKTDSANWEVFMLIDPGDRLTVVCGAATNAGGKARYTVAGGHGFRPGDSFRIGSSTISGWDRSHRILATTGDLFVRRVDADSFTLHPSAATAHAGTSTIDITAFGSGSYFWVSTPHGGRHVVENNVGGINTTTNVLTTEDDHGFQTGERIVFTPQLVSETLPAPIQTYGTITLNTAYDSAGDAGTTYTRSNRLENVYLDNVVMEAPNGSLNDGNLIKINNSNQCSIRNTKLYAPRDTVNSIVSLRFGFNNRNVDISNTYLANGMIINTQSLVSRLNCSKVDFGDGYNLPSYAIEQLQAIHARFYQCTFRASTAFIEFGHFDDDVEYHEYDDCEFEGTNSSARIPIFLCDETYTRQMVTGGKVFFKPNNRRTNHTYTGATATFLNSTDVVTVTNHCLSTGDEIYFTSGGGTLPSNVVSGTVYFVRVTGNDTFTIHDTKAASTLAGATPRNLGSDGSGSLLAHSPIGKIGTKLIQVNSGDTKPEVGFLLRCRESAMDLEDWGNTNATDADVFMPLGLKVWNMNQGLGQPLGWIVTEASTPATTVATLSHLPYLSDVVCGDVTEVGNVGTGEDTLIGYTLPANTLYAEGCSLEIEAGFSFANNTNAKQVKMYLGANQIYASGSSAHQSGGMCFRAVVIRDAVNTAKVSVSVTSNGSNTPFAIAYGNAFVQPTVDWSTDLGIAGTGEATSNNDIVMEFLRVKVSTAAP
jgi:hypothetical protein